MSYPEIPAIVTAVVCARAGRDWRRQFDRMTAGEHFGVVGVLRPEVAWVLHRLGYPDSVIGQALGVSAACISRGRRRFLARLAGDAELRAWFATILPAADNSERRAVAA